MSEEELIYMCEGCEVRDKVSMQQHYPLNWIEMYWMEEFSGHLFSCAGNHKYRLYKRRDLSALW